MADGQTARKEAVCPGGSTEGTPPSTHAFLLASLSNTPQGLLTYQHSVHTHLLSECITLRQGGARGERADRGHQKRESEAPSLQAPPIHTAPPSTLTAPRALQGRAEERAGHYKNTPLPLSPIPRFFLVAFTPLLAKQAAGFSPVAFYYHTPSSPDTIGRPPSRGLSSAAVSDAGSAPHPTGAGEGG